jgi:hypothetical protein
MKTLKTVVTLIAAQGVFLFAFGVWGLLAFPIAFLYILCRLAVDVYRVEHLRLEAEQARVEADEAEEAAANAREVADYYRDKARESGWFVPTWENFSLN